MPKKLERCVKDVKKQGKDESSAYAICSSSTGYKKQKGGGWKKEVKESMENKKIVEFIKTVVDKDFSAANEMLQKVIDEKIKSRIRNYNVSISKKDTEK